LGTIFQLIDSEIPVNKAIEIGLKLVDKEESFFLKWEIIKDFSF